METKKLLEGLDEDDINSVLKKYTEIFKVKKEIDDICENLKVKVKIFMKEKKWNNYKSGDISISITKIERQTLDKDKLKLILSKQQLDSISKFKVIERVLITTKEQREKMRGFLDGKTV